MREVVLKYTILKFIKRQVNVTVPEKWEDISLKQFSVCSSIYIEQLDDVYFVSQFFGLKKWVVNRLTKFELYKLTELADFAIIPKGMVNFFYFERLPGTTLKSPQSLLKNVSFEHFSIFDTYFFDYVNQPTNQNLIRFVCALYIRENESITSFDFNERIKYISKKVDIKSLYAVFLNYIFIRKWLSKAFPFVFEQKTEDNQDTGLKTRNLKKDTRPDWNAILDSLVSDDIIHYDEYKKIQCLTVFKTINKRIKNYTRYGR